VHLLLPGRSNGRGTFHCWDSSRSILGQQISCVIRAVAVSATRVSSGRIVRG